MLDDNIIDLMQYKKQKAREAFNRLDPELKLFVKSSSKDIKRLMERSLDEIPDDVIIAIDLEDDWLDE